MNRPANDLRCGAHVSRPRRPGGRHGTSRGVDLPGQVDPPEMYRRHLGESEPQLTVIVPVYNEQATIDRLLAAVVAVPYQKQIIVVDDASSDESPALLREWAQAGQIELLVHTKNQGKGAAMRTGLARA